MSNELLNTTGSYATAQAASSTANGVMSVGTVSTIATAISAEQKYLFLDFRVNISVGTPVAGGVIDIFRRAGDGTNQAPIPQVADFLDKWVGGVLVDNATGFYYFYGVDNPDPNDSYYMLNRGGATLTLTLAVRGRTPGNV